MTINSRTDLEKIQSAGGEVIIKPAVFDVTKIGYFTVRLSSEAASAKLDFATMAMFFKQKDYLQNYWRDNKRAPDEIVAPLSFQELFSEVAEMSKLHMDGFAETGETLSVEIIDAIVARNRGYTVQSDTADYDPFVHLIIPPGPKGDKGDKGDTGASGAKGDKGDAGECPDCTNPPPGWQPTGPGPQPPGPTGGGDGGTEPGGGDWTNPSGYPGSETSICGEPIQIYAKDLVGLRSFIFAPAQLLNTDFDYPHVNLRPGIDAVGAKTFINYEPANLKSATLLLDMDYLVSETIPTPLPNNSFKDITFMPTNTMPKLWADTSRTSLLGQFGSGSSSTFSIPLLINGTSHTVSLTAGETNFAALTIDVSGNKQVYIDGSVCPLPIVAGVIDNFLNGRVGARIFVSCLTYDNPEDCLLVPFYQDFNEDNYPFQFGSISNQDGWEDDNPDYAITYAFDSKVYLKNFHVPTSGNARDHLKIMVSNNRHNSTVVHLSLASDYNTGVDIAIDGFISDNTFKVYRAVDVDFDMVAGTCYALQWHDTQSGVRTTAYQFGVAWE